jgi:RNA polymerase II subunit A small phosphatase-like protein
MTPVSYSSSTKPTDQIFTRESVKIPDQNKDLKQLLPPQSKNYRGRKTLVLDLDETLVHAKFLDSVENKADHFFKINFKNKMLSVQLYIRPGAQDFIREMAKQYEVVIFTASRPAYANKVIDIIDPDNLVAHRLFRDSCSEHHIIDQDSKGKTLLWVKDMSRLSRYIDDVVIIDNSPSAYIYQKENGMPIDSWTGDQDDSDLYKYLNIFRMIAKFNIDLKYIIINIVKDDHSIDHGKFADIVNAAISKDNFAKKTKEYRIAHEISCSPARKSINYFEQTYDPFKACQIQKDFNICKTEEDDSDSDKYSTSKNTYFNNVSSSSKRYTDHSTLSGSNNIINLIEVTPKYKSSFLRKFEDSMASTVKSKGLFDNYKKKSDSRKSSCKMRNPIILIDEF